MFKSIRAAFSAFVKFAQAVKKHFFPPIREFQRMADGRRIMLNEEGKIVWDTSWCKDGIIEAPKKPEPIDYSI